MAKRTRLDEIFKRTDIEPGLSTRPAPGDADDDVPAEGRTLAVGVGLKESEVQLLDEIAQTLGIARNGLMRYAVRHFLRAYQNGEINLSSEVETPNVKKRLRMP